MQMSLESVNAFDSQDGRHLETAGDIITYTSLHLCTKSDRQTTWRTLESKLRAGFARSTMIQHVGMWIIGEEPLTETTDLLTNKNKVSLKLNFVYTFNATWARLSECKCIL